MNAESTLRLWRRILRDDRLQRSIFGSDDSLPAGLDLSDDEIVIAHAFREHRAAAYWPLRGFRFRLVSSVESALELATPVTLGVLRAYGYEIRSLITDFLEEVAWTDHGAFEGRAARAFLAFARQRLASKIVGLEDLVDLETAKLGLLARIASTSPLVVPASAGLDDARSYVVARASVVVPLAHRLEPWFAEPEKAHEVALVAAPHRVAVSLSHLDAPPHLAALSPDAEALLEACADPMTVRTASSVLGSMGRARHVMAALLDLGLLEVWS